MGAIIKNYYKSDPFLRNLLLIFTRGHGIMREGAHHPEQREGNGKQT
jgi:hypothetical protein